MNLKFEISPRNCNRIILYIQVKTLFKYCSRKINLSLLIIFFILDNISFISLSPFLIQFPEEFSKNRFNNLNLLIN